VASVKFMRMTWFPDVATVQIPTSKSDTPGLMSYAKKCSENPWNPLCCLVTALSADFLSRSGCSSFQFLFGNAGDSTDYMVTRMQTALKTILAIVGEENLGVALHRWSVHFLKKTGIAVPRSNHECVSHDSRGLRAYMFTTQKIRNAESNAGKVILPLSVISTVFFCYTFTPKKLVKTTQNDHR